MAGDWLKVEVATPDKPEIWLIAEELQIDPDAVVGKLLRVWAWFDQQTENGNAPIVTKMLLDRKVGVTGFCNSIIKAGWMQEEEYLSLPNFDRHNGQTAKNRALTAKRVAKHKKTNADGNDKVTPAPLPREEKRREEKSITTTPTLMPYEGMLEPLPPKQKRFVEPSLEDVREYFYERGETQSEEPQRFHDYYSSNGWKVSSNKMKDWKASARGWISRNKSAGNNTFNQHPANYPTMASKASKREALTASILSNDTSW
jgi:hypothetical protein